MSETPPLPSLIVVSFLFMEDYPVLNDFFTSSLFTACGRTATVFKVDLHHCSTKNFKLTPHTHHAFVMEGETLTLVQAFLIYVSVCFSNFACAPMMFSLQRSLSLILHVCYRWLLLLFAFLLFLEDWCHRAWRKGCTATFLACDALAHCSRAPRWSPITASWPVPSKLLDIVFLSNNGHQGSTYYCCISSFRCAAHFCLYVVASLNAHHMPRSSRSAWASMLSFPLSFCFWFCLQTAKCLLYLSFMLSNLRSALVIAFVLWRSTRWDG